MLVKGKWILLDSFEYAIILKAIEDLLKNNEFDDQSAIEHLFEELAFLENKFMNISEN